MPRIFPALLAFTLLALSTNARSANAQDQIAIGFLGGAVVPVQDSDFAALYEPWGSGYITLGFPLEGDKLTAGLEIGVDLFPLDKAESVRRDATNGGLRIVRLEEGDLTVFTVAAFIRLAFGDIYESHPYIGAGAGIANVSTKNILIQRDGENLQLLTGMGTTDLALRLFAGYAYSISETTHLLVEPSYHFVFRNEVLGYAGLRVGFLVTP